MLRNASLFNENTENGFDWLPDELLTLIMQLFSPSQLMPLRTVSRRIKLLTDHFLHMTTSHPGRMVMLISELPSATAYEWVCYYRLTACYRDLSMRASKAELQAVDLLLFLLTKNHPMRKLTKPLKNAMDHPLFQQLNPDMQQNFIILYHYLNYIDARHTTGADHQLTWELANNKIELEINLRGFFYTKNNDIFLNLSHAQLAGYYFFNRYENAICLKGVNFDNANLAHTNFMATDLTHAHLRQAILTNAIMTEATLIASDLAYANLENANLQGALLCFAKLRQANLAHAKLFSADLSDTDLRKANFSYAHLKYANLAKANLSGANLSHANLATANLNNANLSNTTFKTCYFGKDKNDFASLDGILLISLPADSNMTAAPMLAEIVKEKLDKLHAQIHKHTREKHFRAAIVKNIQSLVMGMQDTEGQPHYVKQLALIDLIIQLNHPIFTHRSSTSKITNDVMMTAMTLFSPKKTITGPLVTTSQGKLIKLRKGIAHRLEQQEQARSRIEHASPSVCQGSNATI